MFFKWIACIFCLLLSCCGYYSNEPIGTEYRISCVNLNDFLVGRKIEHTYKYSGVILYVPEYYKILKKDVYNFDYILIYSDVVEVSYMIIDSYMGLSRTDAPYQINGFDVLSDNIMRETDNCSSEAIYKQGGGDELLESFFTNNSADSIQILLDKDNGVVVGIYDGGYSPFYILIRHPRNEIAVKGVVRFKSLPTNEKNP